MQKISNTALYSCIYAKKAVLLRPKSKISDTMKKLLAFALMCAMIGLVGCKKNSPVIDDDDEPEKTSTIVGIWQLDSLREGGVTKKYTSALEYLRFTKDMKMDEMVMWENDSLYIYENGTYELTNGDLIFKMAKFMEYKYIQNIPRLIGAQIFEGESYPINLKVRSDKMQYSFPFSADDTTTYFFKRVSSLPEQWNDEFSAPEVEIAPKNVAGTWQYVGYVTKDWYYYYYYYPDYMGFVLYDTQDMYFEYWGNTMLENFVLNLPEGYVSEAQWNKFRWDITDDQFVVTCTGYDAVKYNESGIETERYSVTPEEPLVMHYDIFLLTQYYMIITDTNGTNHLFHKVPSGKAKATKECTKGQGAMYKGEGKYKEAMYNIQSK